MVHKEEEVFVATSGTAHAQEESKNMYFQSENVTDSIFPLVNTREKGRMMLFDL